MKKLSIGITLLLTALFGCKNNKVDITPVKTPDIYISGNDSQSRNIYCINGKIYGTDANNDTRSMIVSGDDVYFLNINGYQKNNLQVINVFGGAGFTDMAVSGEDVYIVGYGDTVPFYWKNGQKIKVESDLQNVRTSRIAISENKVYLAGNIYGDSMKSHIFYCSGDKYNIIDRGSVYKIKVDGDDVYILGQDEEYNGCYWKNGIKHQLYTSNNRIVDLRDIYIKNKNVYVVGYCYPDDNIPVYWKNDQPIGKKLYSDMIFSSIVVYNDDVYVLGTQYGSKTSLLWKNGSADSLGFGASKIIVQ